MNIEIVIAVAAIGAVVVALVQIMVTVKGIRDQLFNKLNIQYGHTTADGRFTLLPNCCLGTCDCAPALMIDNDLYRNLTVDQLDEILSKYI